MKNCIDCEHFRILCGPLKDQSGGYWDLGRAGCDKHPGMYAEFGTKATLKKLKCIDEKEN